MSLLAMVIMHAALDDCVETIANTIQCRFVFRVTDSPTGDDLEVRLLKYMGVSQRFDDTRT